MTFTFTTVSRSTVSKKKKITADEFSKFRHPAFLCLHFNLKKKMYQSSNCIFSRIRICWLQIYPSILFSKCRSVGAVLTTTSSRNLSKREFRSRFFHWTILLRFQGWQWIKLSLESFSYLMCGIPTPPCNILYNLDSYNSCGCLALIDSNFTATSWNSKGTGEQKKS